MRIATAGVIYKRNNDDALHLLNIEVAQLYRHLFHLHSCSTSREKPPPNFEILVQVVLHLVEN